MKKSREQQQHPKEQIVSKDRKVERPKSFIKILFGWITTYTFLIALIIVVSIAVNHVLYGNHQVNKQFIPALEKGKTSPLVEYTLDASPLVKTINVFLKQQNLNQY